MKKISLPFAVDINREAGLRESLPDEVVRKELDPRYVNYESVPALDVFTIGGEVVDRETYELAAECLFGWYDWLGRS